MNSHEQYIFEPAGPLRQRQALSLLLTGHVSGVDGQVDQFLNFAREQNITLDQLWGAYFQGNANNREPQAAALVVPSAGRTAMIFVSPMHRKSQPLVHQQLIRAMCSVQQSEKLRMIQALLDTGQTAEKQALNSAGFTDLATLLYMERSVASGDAVAGLSWKFSKDYELVNWNEERRPLFEKAILQSYEQTLDCPALLGLRKIEDIIEGHMSTGVFDPKLWFLVLAAGEPAGLILLNQIPQRQALELVYLGLPPAFRQRGLGRKLVNHALSLVPRYHANALLLAVDQANGPAMTLYRSLGFVTTARKVALIWVL